MQMNQALFMSGGQCGYVLQPANMRDDLFDPFDKSTVRGLEPLSVSIEVCTGLRPCHYLVTFPLMKGMAVPAAIPQSAPPLLCGGSRGHLPTALFLVWLSPCWR